MSLRSQQFTARNVFYLRISATTVLHMLLYLDRRHVEWMSSEMLEKVLHALKTRISLKLGAESTNVSKRRRELDSEKVDVYRGGKFRLKSMTISKALTRLLSWLADGILHYSTMQCAAGPDLVAVRPTTSEQLAIDMRYSSRYSFLFAHYTQADIKTCRTRKSSLSRSRRRKSLSPLLHRRHAPLGESERLSRSTMIQTVTKIRSHVKDNVRRCRTTSIKPLGRECHLQDYRTKRSTFMSRMKRTMAFCPQEHQTTMRRFSYQTTRTRSRKASQS